MSYRTVERPEVARRLKSIMTAQRRGRQRPIFGKRCGRIDKRALARLSTGDERVFSTRGAPSPTSLRLVLLLDMSGSMSGSCMQPAIQMVRDLIDATKDVRSIDLEVWGHTTDLLMSGDTLQPGVRDVAEGDYIKLVELWKPGAPLSLLDRRVNETRLYGNEDGFAIETLYRDAARRKRSGQRVLMVVCSDGAPAYREYDHAAAHVRNVCSTIRRAGDAVVSVSVGHGLRKVTQEAMYGHGSVIEYTTDNNILTRNVATVIGKALQ